MHWKILAVAVGGALGAMARMGRGGINAEELQRDFDGCIGTGDETQSPILRLVRKIAPKILIQDQPESRELFNRSGSGDASGTSTARSSLSATVKS